MLKQIYALLLMCILSSTANAQIPPYLQEVPADVELIESLTFAQYDEYSLQLDLYRPKDSEERLPAIVVISEGGWQNANKQLNAPMAAGLAQRDFVAVSIEYRGASEAILPASVYDTKAAIRWLRANAETYNIAPEAIGAMGGSWGAYLATYAGVTNSNPELEGDGGSNTYSSALSAVVGLSTPINLVTMGPRLERYLGETYASNPSLWEFASPITHVSANSPPLLLMASQADDTVPYEQSLEMVQAYEAIGLDIELALIPEAGHSFWYDRDLFEETLDRAAVFFHKHLFTSH